jgi:hypothetical protein
MNSVLATVIFALLAAIPVAGDGTCVAAAGQRTARVGNPSGSSSPLVKPNKTGGPSEERIEEDFQIRYKDVIPVLQDPEGKPSAAELYRDYRKAHDDNPNLFVGQFFVAKLIPKIVEERKRKAQISDKVQISDQEIIDSFRPGPEGVPPEGVRQLLTGKGLTSEQAREIQEEAGREVNQKEKNPRENE